ncbi:MAG: hypothetical protein FWC86_05370 [Coriobacteriia bacterium]|nr:hypothetical protein [Coriobacteriia bacterium]
MKQAASSREDLTIFDNNRRALGAHFVLSLVGLAVFSTIAWILPSDPFVDFSDMRFIDTIPWLIGIIGSMAAYVGYGYFRLEPTEARADLSVRWITYVIMGFAALCILAISSIWIADSIFGDGHPLGVLAVLYVPIAPLFNSLSFGIFGLVAFPFSELLSEPAGAIFTIGTFFIASFLPPGLFCLGMQLRRRYPYKEKEYPKAPHNDHEGEGDQPWPISAIEVGEQKP